jgi:hypothetical protein
MGPPSVPNAHPPNPFVSNIAQAHGPPMTTARCDPGRCLVPAPCEPFNLPHPPRPVNPHRPRYPQTRTAIHSTQPAHPSQPPPKPIPIPPPLLRGNNATANDAARQARWFEPVSDRRRKMVAAKSVASQTVQPQYPIEKPLPRRQGQKGDRGESNPRPQEPQSCALTN